MLNNHIENKNKDKKRNKKKDKKKNNKLKINNNYLQKM